MKTFAEMLSMGGYSFYVWSAYTFVVASLLGHIWFVTQQKKTIYKKLIHWFSE